MKIKPDTRIRLAVFGQPVAQSLSPRIHGQFAEQFGLDVDYRAIEASPETFPQKVGELAKQGGRGCNITAPFKADAWRLATLCSESATRAGAANTLIFTASHWFAENTDGGGLVYDLRSSLGLDLAGARICVLGAGGAAAGVLASLLREDPAEIIVANRTESRAIELAEQHADLGRIQGCTPEKLDGMSPFDLVINATTLGHSNDAPELAVSRFSENGICYDMNYGKAAEPLMLQCREKGIRYSDGLGMLVGQAALSFRLWTGHKPNAALVLDDLRRTAG